ncbi:PLP-dependent transferase, partial [Salmonella enterica subsp. enterica serovar Montevideo]|nr:PLP-dependent transferase [Salmonella enterica subsp. enterica serovar Montevideo]
KKRLALKPGSEYHYPRQTLKTDDTYLHTVPKYYPHLYGEKEGVPLIGADITQHIQPNTKVVFLESPGSITMEVHDIPTIVSAVRR